MTDRIDELQRRVADLEHQLGAAHAALRSRFHIPWDRFDDFLEVCGWFDGPGEPLMAALRLLSATCGDWNERERMAKVADLINRLSNEADGRGIYDHHTMRPCLAEQQKEARRCRT